MRVELPSEKVPTTRVCAPADLPIESLNNIIGTDASQMLEREIGIDKGFERNFGV